MKLDLTSVRFTMDCLVSMGELPTHFDVDGHIEHIVAVCDEVVLEEMRVK